MTTGSCLCSAVKFEVREFCSGIFKCHCSKCRKAFGGASSAAALADEGEFSWLQGGDMIRQFQTESGFQRCFCERCGSILPQHLSGYKMHWIPAGLLDADPGIFLATHVHVGSKAPWEILDEQTKRLENGFSL